MFRNLRNELALGVAIGPITCYGLSRAFPSPHTAFLVVMGAINVCASIIIRELAGNTTNFLIKRYEATHKPVKADRRKFHHLSSCFMLSMGILLPIFYRSVGQRMGCQVPDFLLTIAHSKLAYGAFCLTRSIIDLASLTYQDRPVF